MVLKNITSEPIIFLYAIVYMVNLSILPQLVLQKVCLQQFVGESSTGNLTSSKNLCYTKTSDVMTPEAKKESTRWWFIIIASAQVPSILTVLIWGPISDVIGRKKAMLVIPTVSILQNIIFVLCSYYPTSNLLYLCLGMFLSCFFGDFAGVIALCCGFIADVTAGDNIKSRIARMAFVDFSINMAGIPAGLLGGQLLKWIGFTAVFGFSITVNVVLLLYIVFKLPDPRRYLAKIAKEAMEVFDDAEASKGETKKLVGSTSTASTSVSSQATGEDASMVEKLSTSTTTSSINWDLLKPHKQIYQVFKVITHKERRHLILPPLLAFSFVIYAFVGELTTTALYLKGKPLTMSPDFIGYYYAAQALIRSIGVVATTQFAHRVLKTSDINVLLFGIFSQVGCYLLIGFSKNTISVFFANILGFAVAVALSLSRSYTSKHVPPEQIGTLMAAFEALDALAFVTNLLSLEIYSLTLDKFSGSVFLFLSGCSLIGFVITLCNKIYVKRHSQEINKDINRQLKEELEL